MDLNLTDINLIANLNDLEIEEIMNSNNGVKEQVYKLLDKNLFENQSRKMNTIFEKLYSKKFT